MEVNRIQEAAKKKQETRILEKLESKPEVRK